HHSAPPDTYSLSLHDALPIFARFGRVVTRPGFLSPASYHTLTTMARVDNATSAMGAGWFVRPRNDSLPLRLNINGSNAGLQAARSEEHTSELQSRRDLVCRLL